MRNAPIKLIPAIIGLILGFMVGLFIVLEISKSVDVNLHDRTELCKSFLLNPFNTLEHKRAWVENGTYDICLINGVELVSEGFAESVRSID